VRSQGAFTQTVKGLRNALDKPAVRDDQYHHGCRRTYIPSRPPWIFLAELGVPTIGLKRIDPFRPRGGGGYGALRVGSWRRCSSWPAKKTENARPAAHLVYAEPSTVPLTLLRFDLGVKGCTPALYNMCVGTGWKCFTLPVVTTSR